jgi:hypothetical protein
MIISLRSDHARYLMRSGNMEAKVLWPVHILRIYKTKEIVLKKVSS